MAQIWGRDSSDTGKCWLRYGTWWFRYGDVVAQIQGHIGSDIGTWWLRYGDVVAKRRGGSNRGYSMVTQIRDTGCSDRRCGDLCRGVTTQIQ